LIKYNEADFAVTRSIWNRQLKAFLSLPSYPNFGGFDSLKIAFLTSTFHSYPVGIHAKFHDILHYLDVMDNPPFEWEVITSNYHTNGTDITAPVVHSNGNNRLKQIVDYMRVLRDRNDEVSIYHLNQTDLRLAVPTVIATDPSVPLVAGPNISTYHRPNLAQTLPRDSLHRLKIELRLSSVYRNRVLYNRLSPFSISFDTFVAFSEHHRQRLIETGVDSSKIKTLPPGVRPDIFHPGDSQSHNDVPTFLFVGNSQKIYWKGFDLFVSALGRFRDASIDFQALVVGTPPDSEGTELIAEAGISDNLEIVGRVPRADLPKHYREADALINPSRYETEGMTSIEARACGTPVIGSNIDAFSDKNTLTFASGDTDGLYDRMMDLISELAQYQRIAQSTVKKWDIKHSINRLDEVYSRLTD
jgi:glycosyltransferase involved in cell wall biosynthesis